ncbi:MAG: YfiR/HmsC-like, partial [Planctomycetaceae bacterium]|nr:YfiR/HmsC-like [Planctomycetaceae bacterium]
EELDFASQRGHVGFYTAQNNVKFEINNKSAGNAGLKISSKLLRLGRIVGEKPGQ